MTQGSNTSSLLFCHPARQELETPWTQRTPRHRCSPPPREIYCVYPEIHGRRGWCWLTLSQSSHWAGRGLLHAPHPMQPAQARYQLKQEEHETHPQLKGQKRNADSIWVCNPDCFSLTHSLYAPPPASNEQERNGLDQ